MDRILRSRIIAGELAPGARLPHRVELGRTLGTTVQTLQRAIDRLVGDGFLYAKKGEGTFVCPHPPHLYRVGLAFHEPGGSLFDRALAKAAQGITNTGPQQIAEYFQFDRRYHEILSRDVTAHLLAGLILMYWHPASTGTPIIDERGIPRVLINAHDPVLPTAYVDLNSFAQRAVQRLAERGRRKIAVLYFDASHAKPDRYARAISDAGLETRPYWMVPCSENSPQFFMQMLRQLPPSKWPDGLVIADDNLVDRTVAGLLEQGWRVPCEMSIIAHTNFPLVVPSPLPIERLGFDCRLLLTKCLEILDRQRLGQPVAKHTSVSAQFEDELSPVI